MLLVAATSALAERFDFGVHDEEIDRAVFATAGSCVSVVDSYAAAWQLDEPGVDDSTSLRSWGCPSWKHLSRIFDFTGSLSWLNIYV